MFSFDVLIKLSNKTENSYNFDNSLYDFPKLKDGYFHYHFNANNSNGEGTPSIIMTKWQVDLLESICKKEFGENNFELNIDYNYIYDSRLFHEFVEDINSYEFFQDLKNIIDEEGISVSETKQSIGVDFNWRETDPDHLKIELSNKYDDMEVSIFSDHRCNVEISDKNADWDKIEAFLKENYSSLKTYISPKDGSMHFVQEYRTPEQASQFRFSISASLNHLREMGCECEIHPNEIGKKKYLLRVDQNKIAENKESIVNSLRGAEFSVGGHSIGKLFKIF